MSTVTGQSLMDFDIDSDTFKETDSKNDGDHSVEVKKRFLNKVTMLRNALRLNKFGLVHTEAGKPRLLEGLCERPKVVQRKSIFTVSSQDNRRSSNFHAAPKFRRDSNLSERLNKIEASQEQMLKVVKNLIASKKLSGVAEEEEEDEDEGGFV
eukprot:g6728.t1